MKTYDGHRMIIGHQYFVVYIKTQTNTPVIEKARFTASSPGCKCSACKKGILLETLKDSLSIPSLFEDYFVFKNFDKAKQLCLSIMENFQECLNKKILSIERTTKESLV